MDDSEHQRPNTIEAGTPQAESIIDNWSNRFKTEKGEKPTQDRIRKGLRATRIHGYVGTQLDMLSRGSQSKEDTQKNLAGELIKLETRIENLRSILERLQGIAYLDALTGIPSRRSYDEYLANNVQNEMGIVFIDADRFRDVNKFGHDTGDAVLKIIANTMLESPRIKPLIFRIGGDEFAAIFENQESPEQLKDYCEEMRLAIEKREVTAEKNGVEEKVPFTISAGGGIFRGGSMNDLESFKTKCDMALMNNKMNDRRNTTYILGVDQ